MQPAFPFYRHYKTGDLYRKICDARLEATEEPMVVYANTITGETWTRPTAEFEGTVSVKSQAQRRFTPLHVPTNLPLYRHYKGGMYLKLCDAYTSGPAEPVVVFIDVKTGYVMTRPKAEFEDMVQYDGQQQKRFTLVALPADSEPAPQ